MCPVFVATTSTDPRPDPSEVEAWEWVPWPEFRDDVLTGRRKVSQWCVEQVQALPDDPLSSPPADPGELPPAAY
jgi:isopentenyl-diphosphate delta-isomerase